MAKVINNKVWYTPEELGPMIGHDPDYLRELARGRRGKTLPAEKIGRRWYFDYDAVVAHLGKSPTTEQQQVKHELLQRLGV